MLSKKLKKLGNKLDVDNNTLICLALLDLVILMLLIARFVVPDWFQPGYVVAATDALSLNLRMVVCAGIPLLLGLFSVFFGIKSIDDMRKHHHNKVSIRDWKYWLYFVTIAFGVVVIIKTLGLFALFISNA